ncbi:transglutaminase domain-containing protein [Nonomuraea sp. FMUSA5-5]|uniref:Transglutaminase domain-containing protein n=1 Tax=Nonomuraea composti TaxID=2720023 RepID=A0ABX1AU53_9ACTN|nr:transglutaminase-like domain-containing protein [Nonomuraea sp. FMUSA5-5]NJP89170.1 transglutaminase domain-containing protein [Nonomuraea sp. FMUSA5-5]
MLDFYATQSTFTDPGPLAAWIDGVPRELIRESAARLVFHYWANGDLARHGFTPGRVGEVNLRYADAMLARARELDPAPPPAGREATGRVLGCCRDNTVLYLALARHHGIPARARYGFADYLIPGWWLDHMIPEVWDGERWRLVEPEFEQGYTTPGESEPLPLGDMPRERFLTAGRAWRSCRVGKADPRRFVTAPGIEDPRLRGLPLIARSVVFDLAALNKYEMLTWDRWGAMDDLPGERVDDLAADIEVGRFREAYAGPDVVVPDVVASYPPPDHRRTEITLRAAGA